MHFLATDLRAAVASQFGVSALLAFSLLLSPIVSIAGGDVVQKKFCERKFGHSAQPYLEPASANPSGVADGIGDSSPTYRKDAPMPSGFQCTYSLQRKGTSKKQLNCEKGMKSEVFSEEIIMCRSKVFPIKELCADELGEFKRPGLVEAICDEKAATKKQKNESEGI